MSRGSEMFDGAITPSLARMSSIIDHRPGIDDHWRTHGSGLSQFTNFSCLCSPPSCIRARINWFGVHLNFFHRRPDIRAALNFSLLIFESGQERSPLSRAEHRTVYGIQLYPYSANTVYRGTINRNCTVMWGFMDGMGRGPIRPYMGSYSIIRLQFRKNCSCSKQKTILS